MLTELRSLYHYTHPEGYEIRLFASKDRKAYSTLANLVRIDFPDTRLDDWVKRRCPAAKRCTRCPVQT